MPNDIRTAKRINQLMEERMNSSDCEGIDKFHYVAEEKTWDIGESMAKERYQHDSGTTTSTQLK